MSNRLAKSIELAKAGFENAQEQIRFIDTKVGIAVGLLLVLLPGQLGIVGWFLSEGGDDTKHGFARHFIDTCPRCWLSTALVGVGLLGGMLLACLALYHGISCLVPRGPKGYGKSGPFQNEFQPNVLFPIYTPDQCGAACEHFKKLSDGVDDDFVLAEYQHQLEQLGRILHKKFDAMKTCFKYLRIVLFLYALAVLAALWIGFHALGK